MRQEGTPGKTNRRRNTLLAALAVFLLPATFQATGEAQAQEYRREQRGLLDFLFGGAMRNRQQPAPAREARPQKPSVSRQRSYRPAAAAPSQPPTPPAAEKLESARTVLVVGDFLAGGLAEGLEAAYALSPGVRIIGASNGSSGFVRDDYYNWNAEIAPLLDEHKPTIVVVMVGSNDRQQMKVGENHETPRSEAWLKEYRRRVDDFADTIRERNIPLIWSGLPSFKSPSMSSDMLAFNDIYKTEVDAASGTFVDIWDGFVDENGAFIFTGPDMNGQPARLRGSDGINLTRAGKRKLAFYVEKPLNKLLGQAVAPDIGEVALQNLPEEQQAAAPAEPVFVTRTAPIALTDPVLDGGTDLLGAEVKPIGKLIEEGRPERPTVDEAQPGRADDFALRPVEENGSLQ